MAQPRAKRIYALVNNLRNIGPKSDAKIKFIVDSTPFDNDDETPSSGDWIITGRLLPNSDLYRQGSIGVRITLELTFPIDPPKVCVTTNIYHPNVSKEGEVSINILSKNGTWTPTTTLVKVVEEVTDIIDNPSIDRIQYPEAASLYNTDRKQYERVAAEIFNENRSPRN